MSGITKSIPSISSVGNSSPQSTTIISSSYSKTVIFFPISSIPPNGIIFIDGFLNLKSSLLVIDLSLLFAIALSGLFAIALFSTLTRPPSCLLVFTSFVFSFSWLVIFFSNTSLLSAEAFSFLFSLLLRGLLLPFVFSAVSVVVLLVLFLLVPSLLL